MAKSIADLNKQEVEAVDYSEVELAFRNKVIEEMSLARDQREQSWVEFDDQTYQEYRVSNLKARNAYLRPKMNDEDIRTTSGTVREKQDTLLAFLMNLNLDANIEAYDDQNNMLHELGKIMENLLKKSYDLELKDSEISRLLRYDEFLTHGDVFVEDTWIEWRLPDKEFLSFDGTLSGTKWKRLMDKVYKYCETHVLNGSNVYLGNIHEPFLENQPYVITRRNLSRSEANSLYGNWERWKNVPYTLTQIKTDNDDAQDYNNWTLEPFTNGYVEELKYYNKAENNFMIMLNGVLMFPVKIEDGELSTVPLSSLNGDCEYPLAQGSFQKRPNFAYSCSIPSKTKIDQAIFDEMLKALIIKTRKSYRPPIANNTGKALSSKIFDAASIHDGVNPDKIQEIGNNVGVTQSEFNTMAFLKDLIDKKTVNPVFEGQQTKGQQTAREVIELKQQSMMKAGLCILGVVALEKKLRWLRLKNIIKHWTEPVDAEIEVLKSGVQAVGNYRRFSMDTQLPEGTKGERIVEFTKEQLEPKQVYAEEELLKSMKGKNVRINQIDPEVLQNVKYNWVINITPTEKETGMLKAAKFEETMQKILAMGVPLGKIPNLDYVFERILILNDEDPDKIFPPQDNQQNLQGQQMQGQLPQGEMGQQLTQANQQPAQQVPDANSISQLATQ